MSRQRLLVAALTLSLSGFAAWQASEGFTGNAVIPVSEDVPTIGHGSTRWEDGTPVKMGDTITRERAAILARSPVLQLLPEIGVADRGEPVCNDK